MKKLLALLLAVLMVFSMVACGGEKKGDDKFEIVVVPKDSSNPWFVRMDTGVKEYAAAHPELNVYQKEAYPNMTLLEAQPRVESHDNGDTAYNVAKECIKAYPELKGIMGTSSFDAPGVARAIDELGLTDQFFTTGTGMPADNAALLKSGTIKSLTLWDPAIAGQAMISLAVKVLNGETISGPVDLGVDGYKAMEFRPGSSTVLEGQGWITINAENVDSFGF